MSIHDEHGTAESGGRASRGPFAPDPAGNDFSWSAWPDAGAALAEVDGLIAALEAGRLPSRLALSVLFAPTGPIQEVSISSGWGEEFLALAGRYDAAVEAAYNASWWRRLLNR